MSMWVFQTFSARANLKRRLKERERSESKLASCIRCLFFLSNQNDSFEPSGFT